MSRPSTPPNKTLNNLSNIHPQLKVTILDHKVQEECVFYTIKLLDEQSNDSWVFDSRFSEISMLNNAIISTKRVPLSDLPKFPKKKLLWSNNKDPIQIIKRRQKLETYLNSIFSKEKILSLDCVQSFIKRIKRENDFFKKDGRKTLNLEKNIEKHFLDEIDSNISNSDFMDIMEKYEEYEHQKEESPERTASNFLKKYQSEKRNEEGKDLIKLKKVPENLEENQKKLPTEANEENHNENKESEPFQRPIVKSTVGSLKTPTNEEKVKVVYMSPLLKIDRSDSLKKQDRLKIIELKYPEKKGFFKSYFTGFCVNCSEKN